ncbi:MAG: hypothetical protein ACD_10C00302G0004 [uncultured bacterium]|nr:MAG: hypothetical protein ACD_10C00302G0004 [uncultured bacterium]
MTYFPFSDSDYPELSDEFHCERCGADVSRGDYFNNNDCPECGRPCSDPF